MSKFSVKKPLTVLVAVIVVLVLGVVSYFKMTPDLLPNIDLPYVLVITTYPGATPEKVEEEVTKPLEKSMATLENINSVSSQSAANYSMVILEFTDDVNMESISVDIMQKVNQIEGNWNDMVGTPTIMKINPNMLPVMVAAVSMDGMDTVELSTFVNDTLLPALEGTTGVASITADGVIVETMQVTLDKDKIAALNETLRGEIDKELDKAKEELDQAKEDLENGKAELESGKTEMESGKDALINGMGDANSQIGAQQTQLNDAKLQITTQIAALESKLTDLETTESMLAGIESALNELVSGKETLESELAVLREIETELTSLYEQQLAFEAQKAAIELNTELTDEEKAAEKAAIENSEEYLAVQAGFAAVDAKLAARGLTQETYLEELLKKEASLLLVSESLDAVDLALAELDMDREQLTSSLAELRAGKTQLKDAIDMLNTTLVGLNDGQTQLTAAMAELEKQKLSAVLELSAATTQIVTGEMQMTSAQTQIDQGLQALEDGRQTAYDQADLETILSMETVSSLLMAQNFSMPAGYAVEDGISTLVSVGDNVTSLEDLRTLVLLDLNMDGIEPILLGDIATVEMIDNRDEVYARVNNGDGVLLSFSKQSSYATAEVSENIMARFEELSKEYPGLHFVSLMDQGDYIYMIVESIFSNLIISALFSVLILFLFLKDIKPTFITLCSIPLSVLFALVLMYFSGVTLNLISMSALAVSIGMLVDNGVVVIENIYRLRNKGVDPIRAAVSGASQVAGAIAASTLTTVCVFLPIVFVEGMTRDLFVDMALTLGYALMASLIVALTLVPTMSVRLLNNQKEHSHKIFDWFIRGYSRVLKFTLRHKVIVLLLTVVCLVVSVWLALGRGFSFMPEMSSQQVSVSVTLDRESTVEQTKAVTTSAIDRIRKIEGVQTVGGSLASGGMFGMGGNANATSASIYVILEEDYIKKSGDITKEINKVCADLPGEIEATGSAMDMGALMGSGISINVYGDDLNELQKTANELADLLDNIDGLKNVFAGEEAPSPELHLSVDKLKAAEKGLTVAQVYQEIAAALTTESTATSITENGNTYDVVIVKGESLTPADIENFVFTVTDKEGNEQDVKITDIATVTQELSPRSISRSDQRRYITVTAEVEDGYTVSDMTAAAEKAVKNYKLPDGVTIEFTGENETVMEAMEQLVLMLLLGILLVYLIMVAQFQSLKSPFIVMFTIPLAFTGGFMAILISGMDVSVISIIGFVMLTGIIVNNGIVLVDYINQLRAGGMAKKDALIEAGVTRMRPILMTSVTTILGFVMTAIGIGGGSEMMQPIAVVCIGGMIYATLMTLFIIPIMYDMFNRKEEYKVVTDDQLTAVEE